MNLYRYVGDQGSQKLKPAHVGATMQAFLEEGAFQRTMLLESKRAHRSQKSFLLMLLDASAAPRNCTNGAQLIPALLEATRATDVKGWYRHNTVAGVMFTEFGGSDSVRSSPAITARICDALRCTVPKELFSVLQISLAPPFPTQLDSVPKTVVLQLPAQQAATTPSESLASAPFGRLSAGTAHIAITPSAMGASPE